MKYLLLYEKFQQKDNIVLFKQCEKEAKKYTNIDEFKYHSFKYYLISKENDWLTIFFKDNEQVKRECEKESQKYDYIKDFKYYSYNYYLIAQKNNWIGEFFKDRPKPIKKEVSRNKKKRKDSTHIASIAPTNIKVENILDKESQILFDKCDTEAKKYKYLKDFKYNAFKYYLIAKENDWLKKLYKDNIYINYYN